MPKKTTTPPPVDSRAYRTAAGTIAKGVTVVAAGEGDGLRAMTASAVNSVSLEPMLNLVCVHKKARLLEALQREERFSVNILRREQKSLSNYFAGMWPAATPPEFQFTPWHGVPRLQNCAAAVACEVHQMIDSGDHWVVIGRIIAVHQGEEPIEPLLFYRGHYRELSPVSDIDDKEIEDSAFWAFPW